MNKKEDQKSKIKVNEIDDNSVNNYSYNHESQVKTKTEVSEFNQKEVEKNDSDSPEFIKTESQVEMVDVEEIDDHTKNDSNTEPIKNDKNEDGEVIKLNNNEKISLSSFKLTNLPNKHIKNKKYNRFLVGLSSLITAILIVFLPNLIMRLFNFNKIMPKTTVSAIQVGGRTNQQFKDEIQKSYNSKKIKFTYKNQIEEVSYKDIGLEYDYNATFNKAISAHRNNVADLIFFWRNVDIEPQYSIDKTKLNNVLNLKYNKTDPPKNAELFFSEDQDKFIINPEQSGTGINVDKAYKNISSISRINDKPTIELVESEIKPDIVTSDLERLNSNANEYLNNPITINWLGLTETITNSQKKDWIKLKNDENKYLSELIINPDEPKNYITNLINNIKKDQATKEVISAEGFQVVIAEGSDGREVINPERYIAQFTDAFSSKQPLTLNIEVKTIPRQVKDYSTGGGRWLYVDLSEFKMVAYEGSNPVRTFAISSGTAIFPTVTGNFKVYSKIRSQTMKGGSGTTQDPFYSVPNVEWVSYFTGNYGIHGVYWHSDFGIKNRSHGCVGITNTEAEWIYNWDSIGTPVIVRQ